MKESDQQINDNLISVLINFFRKEKKSGAEYGGVFGGSSIKGELGKRKDVDVVIVKKGAPRGGLQIKVVYLV